MRLKVVQPRVILRGFAALSLSRWPTLTAFLMFRYSLLVLCFLFLIGICPAEAQIPGLSGLANAFRMEQIDENHTRLTGAAEVFHENIEFRADQIDFYRDKNLLTASGNVIFVSGTSRIAADSVDYDTKMNTGTFHSAYGIASLGERVDRSMFGTQEPDAYFYGETIEKLGPKRYRLTRGAFTTCVQPTPRWELVSQSVTIELGDHALLRNTVIKVKGVPVFYLPVMYYPITEDDRSTGFLMPTYGNSTYRGQSLSNAFFWAINRSQDLTLLHDWFTKTGQGMGGEYRYIAGPGSDGNARVYFLREKETLFQQTGGSLTVPERRSYQIQSSLAQVLPGRLRARGRVDYFSNATVQQLYNQNIYDQSQRSRAITANVSGSRAGFNYSGTYDRREIFFGTDAYGLFGAGPRLGISRGTRALGRTPIYVGAGLEYARLLREDFRQGLSVYNANLSRWDGGPNVRVPFSKWAFLTINSSAALRLTYYTESLDARGVQVPQPVWRKYLDMRAEVVGPVLTRVWNTPNNGYAEKFKHVVEPFISFDRITKIQNREQIVQIEGNDLIYGGSTRITYGLVNRFLAKVKTGAATARSRPFVTVSLNQSYYTDALASQFDTSYGSSYLYRKASNFSTVSFGVDVAPTDRVNGNLRLEYDATALTPGIVAISASGAASKGDWLRVSGNWSNQKLIRGVFGVLSHYVGTTTNVHTPGNRLGGSYGFTYDASNQSLLQQRFLAYYNAQCCGFTIEYSEYNFPSFPGFVVPKDKRFNVGFTLAGVGTFSNFLGAFGVGSGARRAY